MPTGSAPSRSDGSTVGERGVRTSLTERLSDRTCTIAIVLVGAALFALQLVRTPGYVLDDWFAYRNVWFEGPVAAADAGYRLSRPGAGLTFGLAFGYAGHSQVGLAVVRMLLVVLAAVLFYLVLRKFLDRPVALLAALAWLVLPNHLSLELWSSALVAAVSLVALLGGCLLLARPRPGWGPIIGACVLFAASALTYESSALPAAVVAVVLPWLASKRFEWRPVAAVALTLGGTTLWSVTHWHEVKKVQNDLAQYSDVFQAHFGWGILPTGPIATLGLVAALVGVVLVLARLALPDRRRETGPADWMVVAGMVVVLVGSFPFAFYYYAPLGAGDRVSYVSSLGGAMVVVGLLWLVWARRREVAVALAVGLLALTGVARAERLDVWATAGDDGARIFQAIRAVDPTCATVVLGPAPIQRQNVAAFLDESNVDGAVQVALDRQDVRGVMAYDQSTFDRVPAECRVDIRPLSDLRADAVVGPN